jgi:hypothetical protein
MVRNTLENNSTVPSCRELRLKSFCKNAGEAHFSLVLCVLFVFIFLLMKKLNSKSKPLKPKPAARAVGKSDALNNAPVGVSVVPAPDAFLAEAKSEAKRVLVTDHTETIKVLRDTKKFTFRAIAEWLTARGIEADHSAVYRAYLAAIPEEQRDPRESWEDVETPE